MMKGIVALLLLLSVSFAWTHPVPSCITQYSVSGANFTYATQGNSIGCSVETSWLPLNVSFLNAGVADVQRFGMDTTTTWGAMTNSTSGATAINISQIPFPVSSNYSCRFQTPLGGASGAHMAITCESSTLELNQNTSYFNITSNSTTGKTNITSINGSIFCNSTSRMNISMSSPINDQAELQCQIWNSSSGNELKFNEGGATFNQTFNPAYVSGDYISIFGNALVHSDFKQDFSINDTNTSIFCKSLIYFNNPYYGNIQLIPKITYIPGVNAFPSFFNASSSVAYVPNNTLTYIFDSVTNIWYIVPAFTCADFNTIGSTSTLQYNPTGTTGAQGGTVPIDLSSLSGSCTYTVATRVINCTGADSSNTLTSLNLTAYAMNGTAVCALGVAGASGNLACVLPATNGTYNAFFYGTDANLYQHQLAYKTIAIGTGTTGYGRDGWIAALLLVGVGAMIMTTSIAVSMILACFALFIAIAFGIIPMDGAVTAAILFSITAFVIAYRLKI